MWLKARILGRAEVKQQRGSHHGKLWLASVNQASYAVTVSLKCRRRHAALGTLLVVRVREGREWELPIAALHLFLEIPGTWGGFQLDELGSMLPLTDIKVRRHEMVPKPHFVNGSLLWPPALIINSNSSSSLSPVDQSLSSAAAHFSLLCFHSSVVLRKNTPRHGRMRQSCGFPAFFDELLYLPHMISAF